MKVYLETSAAAKLLVEEQESEALANHLDRLAPDDTLVSSVVLEIELRRLGMRLDLSQRTISALLERVGLIEANRSLFTEAGLLPGSGLLSLDALHLATAIRAEADVLIGYDQRLLEHAETLGIGVLSPGRPGG